MLAKENKTLFGKFRNRTAWENSSVNKSCPEEFQDCRYQGDFLEYSCLGEILAKRAKENPAIKQPSRIREQ